jgi:hypothetical protein
VKEASRNNLELRCAKYFRRLTVAHKNILIEIPRQSVSPSGCEQLRHQRASRSFRCYEITVMRCFRIKVDSWPVFTQWYVYFAQQNQPADTPYSQTLAVPITSIAQKTLSPRFGTTAPLRFQRRTKYLFLPSLASSDDCHTKQI